MLEKNIEARFVRGVKKAKGRAYKFVSPGNRGVPDRIIVLPKGRSVHESELERLPGGYVRLPGARVIFTELKRPTGRMSARQKWVGEELESLGAEVRPLWSVEQVDEFLLEVNRDGV